VGTHDNKLNKNQFYNPVVASYTLIHPAIAHFTNISKELKVMSTLFG